MCGYSIYKMIIWIWIWTKNIITTKGDQVDMYYHQIEDSKTILCI
jgi:hypothetical protein